MTALALVAAVVVGPLSIIPARRAGLVLIMLEGVAILAMLALAAAVTFAVAAAQAQEKTPAPTKPSLYDRLGGVYPISAVVDDFIDRVYADATVNANPHIAKARNDIEIGV